MTRDDSRLTKRQPIHTHCTLPTQHCARVLDMPVSRCANQCTKHFVKKGDTKFFPYPRKRERLHLQMLATRRRNQTPNEHTRLCSDHFIKGTRILLEVASLIMVFCKNLDTKMQCTTVCKQVNVMFLVYLLSASTPETQSGSSSF